MSLIGVSDITIYYIFAILKDAITTDVFDSCVFEYFNKNCV